MLTESEGLSQKPTVKFVLFKKIFERYLQNIYFILNKCDEYNFLPTTDFI